MHETREGQFDVGPGLARHYQRQFTEIMLKELKKESPLSPLENRTYEKILSIFQVKTVLKYPPTSIRRIGGQRPPYTKWRR